MGLEMYLGYHDTQKQAKALKKQASIDASQRAKETTALAASQKTSFLSSGINLTGEKGTTPSSILSDTYTKGREDINQIRENYNVKLDTLWADERDKLIQQIRSSASSASSAGGGM